MEFITPIKTNDKNLEVGPVEVKNLMQTRQKFCEVFALKFSSFPLSTKLFGVICSVVQVLSSFADPTNFYCDLHICEHKSVEKLPRKSPCRFINVKDT